MPLFGRARLAWCWFGVKHPMMLILANYKLNFLDYYGSHTCVHSQLFDGVEELLTLLEVHAIPWGVVTNKHMRFTNSLAHALGLGQRAAVVVRRHNSTSQAPSSPLLYAAEQMGSCLRIDGWFMLGTIRRDAIQMRARLDI